MAIFHRATVTPTKAELIAEWAPTQTWGPSPADPIDVIGSYRFDDPDGRVGMETHLVAGGGKLMQIPLTYRDAPLEGAEDALITEMQHSVLGPRWVYDGLRDARLVVMLAAALPERIVSMSLRAWPLDFPDDIAIQRRAPFESRADSVMYRQVLADVARARGWDVHLYDARDVERRAADLLAERADEVLLGPRATMGPPWAKDHRMALAATIVAS